MNTRDYFRLADALNAIRIAETASHNAKRYECQTAHEVEIEDAIHVAIMATLNKVASEFERIHFGTV